VVWGGPSLPIAQTTNTHPPRGKPLHLTALGDIPSH
jgi:hypothetical protein